MNYYHLMITEATGVTDATTVEKIEEVMRYSSPTLDGLTKIDFMRLAKRSYGVLLVL